MNKSVLTLVALLAALAASSVQAAIISESYTILSAANFIDGGSISLTSPTPITQTDDVTTQGQTLRKMSKNVYNAGKPSPRPCNITE
jgi:hypothetical protein